MWEQWVRKEKWEEGGRGHRRNSVDIFLYINMHTPPLSYIFIYIYIEERKKNETMTREKRNRFLYVYRLHSSIRKTSEMYVCWFLLFAVYRECSVTDFCRQQQQQRERKKDYTRHHQAIKRKSKREKKTDDYCHKSFSYSSILMFLYLLMGQIVCFPI